MLLGELVEVFIAAIGDEDGEVGAVGQLEGQDRLGMAGMQPLQLWQGPSLSSWRAGDIWASAGTACPGCGLAADQKVLCGGRDDGQPKPRMCKAIVGSRL